MKNYTLSLIMRMTLIFSVIYCFAITAKAQESLYPNNKEPLIKTEYIKLPLGAVKPEGWLRDQLTVQANGLTGHLHEVWDAVKNTGWKGDASDWKERDIEWKLGADVTKIVEYTGNTGLNMYPECCWPRFVPRWLEGLIPLAYQLDDPKLKAVVDEYMNYILNVEKPENVTPSITAWSHLGRVLPVYYEVTHDKRAIELCGRMIDYFDRIKGSNLSPLPEQVQQTRLGMPLSFSWWYYNQTGDSSIFTKMNWIAKNCVDYYRDFFESERTPIQHIVDVCQAIQYPVQYYLYSKDKSYRDCVIEGMGKLDKLHGQVTGRWNGDEYLSGLSPTQGSELCSVTELIYSLVKNFEAIGNPAFADRIETLAFNAVPGTCTGDWWSHQYDQQANQVLVSVDKRSWIGNDNTSNIFGFTPNYPCCLSNMHSSFPNYIQYMWMATNDNGLVAPVYGPCIVNAKVANGVDIQIKEETNYPFSDQIKFTLNSSKKSTFPLYFRIPSWSDSAELSVGGKVVSLAKEKGMYKVEREWNSGDVVILSFNTKVRTEKRMNNAVAVAWGPLYFSLKIGEKFEKIKIREDRRAMTDYMTGVANWGITPSTPWNYGLVIDPMQPVSEIIFNKVSKLPFARKDEPVWLSGATDFVTWSEDTPMVLKMKAKIVPEWKMKGANAADVPLGPLKVNTRETTVELIPYGCTRLRISEFPLINK